MAKSVTKIVFKEFVSAKVMIFKSYVLKRKNIIFLGVC